MTGLIFTYCLTYGGALVALFSPYSGLLIYVCFAILKPESLWHWSVPVGNYSRIVAAAMLVGWAFQGFGDWNWGRARGIVLALVAFWIWVSLGAIQAMEQSTAWSMVESLSKTFLPFVVGVTLIDSVKKLKQLAWVIVLSEGYLAFEFNLRYLAGVFDPVEFDHGNMDNNGIAITMVTSVGLAFFLGLHASRWWEKAISFASAAFMVHTVLFSMSRGGVLALIVTSVMSFLLVPKSPKYYVALLIGLLLAGRLAGPQVVQRFQTTFARAEERDQSAESRLEYWTAALEAIRQNPVLGLGPDQWKLRCPEFGIRLGRAVHSTWVHVGAEFGLVGLLCFALFYGRCIVRLAPLALESTWVQDLWLRYLARMVIVSLVGFIISAQFVTMYGVDLPYYIVLIGGGVLKLNSAGTKEGSENHFPVRAGECEQRIDGRDLAALDVV